MSVIAKLDVLLTANIDQFSKGLQNASSQLSNFVTKGAGMFAGIAAGVAGAATALLGLAIANGKLMADQGRLAERLGITSAEMGGLSLAAARAGMDSDEFAHSLAHFQKEVSKAASDGGEFANRLAQVGLSAQSLNSMKITDAAGAFADALGKLKNQGDVTALSMEAFGKAGDRLIPVLKGGSAQLQQFQEQARKMGLAPTQQETAKVTAMTRAIAGQARSVQGFMNQITIAIAPVVESWANSLSAMVQSATQWIQDNKETFAEWGNILEQTGIVISTAFTAVKEMAAEMFNAFTNFIGADTVEWKNWSTAIKMILVELEFAFRHWKDLVGQLQTSLAWEMAKIGELLHVVPQGTSDALAAEFNKKADELKRQMNEFEKMKEKAWAAKPLAVAPEKNKAGNLELQGKGTGKQPAATERGSMKAAEVILGFQSDQKQAVNVARQQLAEAQGLRMDFNRLAGILMNQGDNVGLAVI